MGPPLPSNAGTPRQRWLPTNASTLSTCRSICEPPPTSTRWTRKYASPSKGTNVANSAWSPLGVDNVDPVAASQKRTASSNVTPSRSTKAVNHPMHTPSTLGSRASNRHSEDDPLGNAGETSWQCASGPLRSSRRDFLPVDHSPLRALAAGRPLAAGRSLAAGRPLAANRQIWSGFSTRKSLVPKSAFLERGLVQNFLRPKIVYQKVRKNASNGQSCRDAKRS